MALTQITNKAEFVPSAWNQVAKNLSSIEGYTWQSELTFKPTQTSAALHRSSSPRLKRKLKSEAGTGPRFFPNETRFTPITLRVWGPSISGTRLTYARRGRFVGERHSSDQTPLAGDSYTPDPFLAVDLVATYKMSGLFGRFPFTITLRASDLGGQYTDAGFGGIDYPVRPARNRPLLHPGPVTIPNTERQNMNHAKPLVALIFASCLAGGCMDYQEGRQRDPNAVSIGVVLPFSGNLSASGTNAERSLLLGMKKINEAGGINGRPLELITEDSHSQVEKGSLGRRRPGHRHPDRHWTRACRACHPNGSGRHPSQRGPAPASGC